MSQKKTKRIAFFSLVFLISTTIFSEPESRKMGVTDLSFLRMNIGGELFFPIEFNRLGEKTIGINVSPFFGIFVFKNLEVRAKFGMSTQLEDLVQKNIVKPPITWDAVIQALYYFDTPIRLKPYLGFGFGVSYLDFDESSRQFLFDFPVGILIELEKNFAIDVGMPMRLGMAFRSMALNFAMPVGFLGFRYVF